MHRQISLDLPAIYRYRLVKVLHLLDDSRVDCALEAMVALAVLLLCGALDAHTRAGVIVAWAFASGIGLCERALDSLVLCWQEDDLYASVTDQLRDLEDTNLRIRSLRHGLHGLEVPDLHRRSGGQNVGS